MLLTLLIFALSLLGLYLYTHHHHNPGHKTLKGTDHRNRYTEPPSNTALTQAQNDEFHCVEAHHPTHCCEAVKELHGKRFLSAQAPTLPINGCDKPHCHCNYIHHEDRRAEFRRSDVGIQYEMYGQGGEVEHRNEHRGRRKAD